MPPKKKIEAEKNGAKSLPLNKQYCTKCEKTLSIDNFWTSDSIVDGNGLCHVCSNCANILFNEIYKRRHLKTDDFKITAKNIVFDSNTEEVFRELCALVDISFKYDAYYQCQAHVESCKNANRNISKIFGVYKSKLSSVAKQNGNMTESLVYANSDPSRIVEDVKKQMYENFEVDTEMIRFWGTTKKEELEFLENEWYQLTTRFECDSYATEMLFQEIAQQRLIIKNKRQQGASVDKELKTLQDLLGSANIKPVQETGANTSEQVTFGTLIKKFENNKPIPEPDEEFKDVDGIMKYISIWFFGHLCKMLGIKNEFSKMYEEEMAKYRVELDEEEIQDDSFEELASMIDNANEGN